MKQERLNAIFEAYDIEQACIGQMKAHIDENQFAKAVELLAEDSESKAIGIVDNQIVAFDLENALGQCTGLIKNNCVYLS